MLRRAIVALLLAAPRLACSHPFPSLSHVKARLTRTVHEQNEGPAGGGHHSFFEAMGGVQHQVDRLMSQPRSAADTWKAYTLCKEQLGSRPEDAALRVRTAEALLAWIRRKTDGNALRADGKHSDSRENRALWKKHAPEALALLEQAKSAKGNEPLYAFLHAEAFMYASCSGGVVKAALKGDAITFKRNAQPLLKQHKDFGSGVGHTFMGAFYLGAPWPVHSASKARDHFKAAQAEHPRCRRNQYYVGLEALGGGRNEEAKAAFERALATPCATTEEQDIGEFLAAQCREGLQLLSSRDRK